MYLKKNDFWLVFKKFRGEHTQFSIFQNVSTLKISKKLIIQEKNY